jgi:hypothetical protein
MWTAAATPFAIAKARVVDAVSDHDHGTKVVIGCQAPHHFDLVLGRLLAIGALDAEVAPDAFATRTAIAGEHRDVPHAPLRNRPASGRTDVSGTGRRERRRAEVDGVP